MDIKRFIEGAGHGSRTRYERKDIIAGTNKVRTYCANASVYSIESSISKITKNQFHIKINDHK